MNDKGYARKLRWATTAYERNGGLSAEGHERLQALADTHSAVHPDALNADPLTLSPESRRMTRTKALARPLRQ